MTFSVNRDTAIPGLILYVAFSLKNFLEQAYRLLFRIKFPIRFLRVTLVVQLSVRNEG